MKIRDVARVLVQQYRDEDGAAVVSFTEGVEWDSMRDASPSHMMVKLEDIGSLDRAVRMYLWQVRKEAESLKLGGGVWASRDDENGVVVVGLCRFGS